MAPRPGAGRNGPLEREGQDHALGHDLRRRPARRSLAPDGLTRPQRHAERPGVHPRQGPAGHHPAALRALPRRPRPGDQAVQARGPRGHRGRGLRAVVDRPARQRGGAAGALLRADHLDARPRRDRGPPGDRVPRAPERRGDRARSSRPRRGRRELRDRVGGPRRDSRRDPVGRGRVCRDRPARGCQARDRAPDLPGPHGDRPPGRPGDVSRLPRTGAGMAVCPHCSRPARDRRRTTSS